jgi:peptidoglycan hydrolase-like protein with peptidoglycan-binding domain
MDNEELEVAATPAAPQPDAVVTPEVVAAAAPEPKVVPAPAAEADREAAKGKKSKPGSALGSVYVQMQALVCCGGAKNSGSVSYVQTRLLELGYAQAGDEKRGYFGVNTCSALKEFQKDSKIKSDDCADLETINALFEGTKVEVLP